MALRKIKLGYYVYYRDLDGKLRTKSLKTQDYATALIRHDEFMRSLKSAKNTAKNIAWHANIIDTTKNMLETSPALHISIGVGSRPADIELKKTKNMLEICSKQKKCIKNSNCDSNHTNIDHKTTRTITASIRYKVLLRDNFKCCACGASPAKDASVELHVDHIIPWSKGGETILENLQTLCSKCNLGKSDI